jgi:hypothetical protein
MSGFRYAKLFDNDSRYRDAEILLRLYRQWEDLTTEKGRQVLDNAIENYVKKHNENWLNFVTVEGRTR